MLFIVGLIALLILIAAAIVYFLILSNRLARLTNDLDRAWANLDLLLKARLDELPKLLGLCRGYHSIAQSTLQNIGQARAASQQAATVEQKARAHRELTGALDSLFVAAASDADLKANNNFRELHKSLEKLGENITRELSSFNDQTAAFNRRLRAFPDILVARYRHLRPRPLFQDSGVRIHGEW